MMVRFAVAPLLALEALAVVMVGVEWAVLGVVPAGAGAAGAEAADRERGTHGRESKDPAYALRHGSPFAGTSRLAIGRCHGVLTGGRFSSMPAGATETR